MEFRSVRCIWCDRPTAYTGTRKCDGCWELERRIRMYPEIAEKILFATT